MAAGSAPLVLVDPATVALHEVAEPARLRALVRAMRASRLQDAPVLLTVEPHGLLVLDGVHRTHALMSLGVPRMLAVLAPRHEVGEPTSWTHQIDVPGGVGEVLRGLHTAPGVVLRDDPAGQPGPVVAQVVTEEHVVHAHAPGPGRGGVAAAYHAIAQTYAALPYRRLGDPEPPRPGQVQVRWVAPRLAEVEALVAAHGALPAGITRFDLPPGPPVRPVSLEDLAAATDERVAAALLSRLRS